MPKHVPDGESRSSPQVLVRATAGMALVTVCSRLSGLARDKAVAALVGAGMVGDAFMAGFRAPNLFRQLLAEGALHATFVPALAQLQAKGEREEVERFVRAMTSTLGLLLVLFLGAGMVGAEYLALALAPEYRAHGEKFALTVYFTRFLFPYLPLISLAALAQGVLNAHRRFVLSAATPIFLNVAMVGGVFLAAGRHAWEWLVMGVLVGGFLQFFLQWLACAKLGVVLWPGAGAFRHPQVRQVLRRALPMMASLGLYPLTVFLSTRFAAAAGEGVLVCVYNASRLNEFVYGVVVVQLATAVLPLLARDATAGKGQAQATFAFALRTLSFVVWPATFFAALFSQEIAGALFGGGKYTPWAVQTTAAALKFYALGMPALALGKVLASAFYAQGETRLPVLGSALGLLGFAAVGGWWTAQWGAAGVAAATSLGQLVTAGTLGFFYHKQWGLPWHCLGKAPVQHSVAALVAALGAWVAFWLEPLPLVTSLASLGQLVLVGVGFCAMYLGANWFLGARELGELWGFVLRRHQR